jgi:DNA topoisomerase-1
MPNLLIVESPAKCKKISGFLGTGWTVLASMGHIRALEEDLDAVGLERDFEPKYRFLTEKKAKAIKAIQDAAKYADEIYLAADDDREGEAIAFSVACLLKRDPTSLPRAVFHEITAKAVKAAVANPRRLDMNRVMAQQARAVLDMMVGFTISPLLWKHVARALSAGRCQTPALRLVWEREQTIQGHSAETSWVLSGTFTTSKSKSSFSATMADALEDQESAMNYLENVHENTGACVKEVVQKPWTLNPPKPLITSTLQQEASALYHSNPQNTMKVAQSLYEAGLITYMRTDHAILSEEAITEAHAWVKENHGEAYIGPCLGCRGGGAGAEEKPKKAPKKSKKADEKAAAAAGASGPPQAQEAHEAIRPTHFEVTEPPGEWTAQEKKIYQLIWRRAVQATMSAAKGQARTVSFTLDADEAEFPWQISAKTTEFQGWQILGATAKLDDTDEEDDAEGSGSAISLWKLLQSMKEGTCLTWSSLHAAPKQTKAQPRFTEATLVRELEKKGIGRPSTFASLVQVLFEKTYVEKKDISGEKVKHTSLTLSPSVWPPVTNVKEVTAGAEKGKLVPTALGESVLRFCLKEFPQLFAYEFTAQMENRLDQVAQGQEEWKQVCRDTWTSYKDDYERLKDKRTLPTAGEKVKDFGGGLKAIMSKTGPLLIQEVPDVPADALPAPVPKSKTRTKKESPKPVEESPAKPTFYTFPEGYTLQTITEEIAREHIASLKEDNTLGTWEGNPILKKKGPYGLYIQCGEFKVPTVEDEALDKIYEKLRQKQQSANNQTRVGEYIFSKGQYGPYMYKSSLKTKVFVSVPTTIDPTTLTVAEAEELYKKQSEAKKAAAAANAARGGRGGRGGFRGGRGGRAEQ